MPGQKAWGIYFFHFCAKQINSKFYYKLSWNKGPYTLMVMRVYCHSAFYQLNRANYSC